MHIEMTHPTARPAKTPGTNVSSNDTFALGLFSAIKQNATLIKVRRASSTEAFDSWRDAMRRTATTLSLILLDQNRACEPAHQRNLNDRKNPKNPVRLALEQQPVWNGSGHYHGP